MSTNEDGMNRVFVIDGIICYPNNTVKMYNRWEVRSLRFRVIIMRQMPLEDYQKVG